MPTARRSTASICRQIEPASERGTGGIPELVLIEQLRHYLGFGYDLKEPHYPYELPGVRLPQSPPALTNCCCFAEGLLVGAWAKAGDGSFQWNRDLHNKMMITDTSDLFSPVTAVIESGMGSAVADVNELPQPWTLVQGWNGAWNRGHTFLILGIHRETGRILTLEANSSYSLDGVGYRHLGNIDRFDDMHPGERWWENDRLWTWERFRESYPNMQLAELEVYDIGWVGGDY